MFQVNCSPLVRALSALKVPHENRCGATKTGPPSGEPYECRPRFGAAVTIAPSQQPRRAFHLSNRVRMWPVLLRLEMSSVVYFVSVTAVSNRFDVTIRNRASWRPIPLQRCAVLASFFHSSEATVSGCLRFIKSTCCKTFGGPDSEEILINHALRLR
jgi:hypothetical protein